MSKYMCIREFKFLGEIKIENRTVWENLGYKGFDSILLEKFNESSYTRIYIPPFQLKKYFRKIWEKENE